jgi:hypothetical protein
MLFQINQMQKWHPDTSAPYGVASIGVLLFQDKIQLLPITTFGCLS